MRCIGDTGKAIAQVGVGNGACGEGVARVTVIKEKGVRPVLLRSVQLWGKQCYLSSIKVYFTRHAKTVSFFMSFYTIPVTSKK